MEGDTAPLVPLEDDSTSERRGSVSTERERKGGNEERENGNEIGDILVEDDPGRGRRRNEGGGDVPKLTTSSLLAYFLGEFGLYAAAVVQGFFALEFFLEVAAISPYEASLIMLLSQVRD
jgi:hypothetical protein